MNRLALGLLAATSLSAAAQTAAPAITQTNIDAAFAYHAAHKGEAMLVQQHGKLLFTKFSAGYDDTPHPIASGTKSFSCAIGAFAEADGLLKLDEPVSKTVTDWQADDRRSITFADLLSLESGLPSDGLLGGRTRTMDTYAAAIDRKPLRAPGKAFIYDPLAFQIFALVLQVKTGGTYAAGGHVSGGTDPVAYLDEKLLTPLGIGLHPWARDKDGHPQMAGGATLKATEWIRYGQFMLDGGKWNGKQLADPKLLARCTHYQGPAFAGYGLTFWLNRASGPKYSSAKDTTLREPPAGSGTPRIAARLASPHVPTDMYMAAGSGKQRLYVIPSLDLVVERLAPLSSETDPWSDDRFLSLLLGTAQQP